MCLYQQVSSDFKDILSRVSQGLVVGSILFHAYLNDFFFCIRKVSAHNFADDNTPSSFPRSVKLLLEILIARFENTIKWFSENKMVVNPDKFKSIIQKTIKPVFNRKQRCRNRLIS